MDHMRQLNIVHPSQLRFPITLVGAGGIGSLTALALTKMGCGMLTVWDFDDVEEHNRPNQFYTKQDLKKAKVHALDEACANYSDVEIHPEYRPFKVTKTLGDVLIVAVDSMKMRQGIWTMISKKPQELKLLIDSRMGGEQGIVYTCRMDKNADKKRYSATLHDDSQAVEEPCTARAIIYNVLDIASKISKIVQRYATGQELPKEIAFSEKTFTQMVEW